MAGIRMSSLLIELYPGPGGLDLVNLGAKSTDLLVVLVPGGHQDLHLSVGLLHPLLELLGLDLVAVHLVGQPLLVVLVLAHPGRYNDVIRRLGA